jgi:cytochrome c553
MCHELHNLSATNTTESLNSVTLITQHNKSFLRANVNKYVTGAATPAYLHTDTPRRVDPHPDAPQAADNPDRAVEGGNDTTARGYCQVCHTLTNYHRSSNTAGAEQCHDGASNTSCSAPPEVHCGACHEHNNNFTGAGGSCTGCHASVQGIRPVITTQFDRFSTHVPGGSAAIAPEDCEVCHDQTGHPGDQIVGLLNADDGGITYEQATAGASTLATGEGERFAPACLSCHDADGASRLPGTGDQTPTSPFTGSGAPPVIDATAWANSSHDRPVATSGSSPVTCVGGGANGCHASGHGSENASLLHPADTAITLDHATNLCFECHDADGPSTLNIFAQFNTGTNYRTTAEDGANVNQRHDVTNTPTDFATGDQTYSGGLVTCKDCHAPHANNDANPVFELDTGVPLPLYSSAGRYNEDGHDFYYDSGGATPTNEDPTDPLGGSGPVPEPDYIQFCLTCHDGTTPAGVTMPVSMINMAAAWNNDQHGNKDGSTGSSISKGNLKPPWNTQATYEAGDDPPNNYAALNCTTCHGAHGTGNIFNLRESITVAGVVMSTGCPDPATQPWCASSEFAGITGTSYTLPVNGGSQNDHEWGAWCTFCHNMSAHRGVDETTGCTSGHKHNANSF